jgi:hypothetical protein
LRRIDSKYRPLVAAAEKARDRDKVLEIRHDWYWERDQEWEQLEGIATDRLLRKARLLEIPIPPRELGADEAEGPHWILGNSGIYYLKLEARWELRRKIRAELDERERRFVTWITLLIGLIGALTGLVSVLSG